MHAAPPEGAVAAGCLRMSNERGARPHDDQVPSTFPDALVKELAKGTAIQAADTLLLTVPNQLGVDCNPHAIESVLKYVPPDLGWRYASPSRSRARPTLRTRRIALVHGGVASQPIDPQGLDQAR